MKKILELYVLDWKRIFKSKMSLLIIIGLMIIPSLYAWFNIMALWDPYGSTSELPIAVVSLDKGTELEEEKYNFGNDIIDNLHENKDIGWVFCDSEEQLTKGVHSGKYFAGIVVEEDFSKNLISFVKGDPIHPQIKYLVNQKINAIAPKISDKGVDSIKAEVTSNLSSAISETVLENANILGTDLDDNQATIENYIDLLNETAANLDQDEEMVQEIHAQRLKIDEYREQLKILDQYPTYADKVYEVTPEVKKLYDSLEEIDQKLQTISSLSQYETQVNDVVNQVNDVHQQILDLNQEITAENNKIKKQLDQIKNQELTPEVEATKLKLEEANQHLSEVNKSLTILNEKLNLGTEVSFTEINKIKSFYEQDWPTVKSQITELNNFLQNDWPELDQKIRNSITTVKTKSEEIFAKLIEVDDQIQVLWPKYKSAIINLTDTVNKTTEKIDIEQVIKILMYNPDSQSDFFADPVTIDETDLYPVPNYGSQSTPFYTALCLWVGGLLLVSVLKTGYYFPQGKNYTKRQGYMARQLTFITIAIFQGLIVELGNIYLLDVYIKNPIINFLSVIFVAIIFNIIIFTFTALLDNFGKVIGIILLVLSVSAGGGNFPIQLSSDFFQMINPLLPFTYAVDLLRESVGGVYIPRVKYTAAALTLMGTITMAVGVIIYPYITEYITKTMEKTKSSHIIH